MGIGSSILPRQPASCPHMVTRQDLFPTDNGYVGMHLPHGAPPTCSGDTSGDGSAMVRDGDLSTAGHLRSIRVVHVDFGTGRVEIHRDDPIDGIVSSGEVRPALPTRNSSGPNASPHGDFDDPDTTLLPRLYTADIGSPERGPRAGPAHVSGVPPYIPHRELDRTRGNHCSSVLSHRGRSCHHNGTHSDPDERESHAPIIAPRGVGICAFPNQFRRSPAQQHLTVWATTNRLEVGDPGRQ